MTIDPATQQEAVKFLKDRLDRFSTIMTVRTRRRRDANGNGYGLFRVWHVKNNDVTEITPWASRALGHRYNPEGNGIEADNEYELLILLGRVVLNDQTAFMHRSFQ